MSDEICAICHDCLGTNNVYKLPECSHNYHTNCIMTWFRLGHTSCPLCNNKGINVTYSNAVEHVTINSNHNSALQYEIMYAGVYKLSKQKDAPLQLKKDVRKVKAYVEKIKKQKEKRREWLKSIPENMTCRQILTRHVYFRRRRWKMSQTLRIKKRAYGWMYGSSIINIIIPKKVNV